MNILDIGIIIFILFGAFLGFKRGFTKELVEAIGFIVVIVLAYFLKNPLSTLMYEYLPFFDFGILKNIEIFNILIYEMLAFLICIVLLSIVLKVILLASSIFEKILNATIILGIPSKILGAIIGIIKNFVIVFGILYIINLTGVAANDMNKSKFTDPILNNTPILSSLAGETVNVAKEFGTIKDKYENIDDNNQFNLETLDLFLKYNIVTPETAQKLIDNGKLKVEGAESIIDKYKERNE